MTTKSKVESPHEFVGPQEHEARPDFVCYCGQLREASVHQIKAESPVCRLCGHNFVSANGYCLVAKNFGDAPCGCKCVFESPAPPKRHTRLCAIWTAGLDGVQKACDCKGNSVESPARIYGWIMGTGSKLRGYYDGGKGVPDGEKWYTDEHGRGWSQHDVEFIPDPSCDWTAEELLPPERTELLPCPWCGGPAVITVYSESLESDDNDPWPLHVHCSEDNDCAIHPNISARDKDDAKNKWNRRVATQPANPELALAAAKEIDGMFDIAIQGGPLYSEGWTRQRVIEKLAEIISKHQIASIIESSLAQSDLFQAGVEAAVKVCDKAAESRRTEAAKYVMSAPGRATRITDEARGIRNAASLIAALIPNEVDHKDSAAGK